MMMEAAGVSPAEINMGFVEILVLLLGIIAFVGSFVLPEKLTKDAAVKAEVPTEEIKKLVEEEVKQASFQIEEKMEETISAATQKTERYMERMSNEKVMAIEEYSNTVLEQINKNHEEAVFLYDMLNNKYAQVKNTVAEIGTKPESQKNKAVTGEKSSVSEAASEKKILEQSAIETTVKEEDTKSKAQKNTNKRKNPAKKTNQDKDMDNLSKIEIQFEPDNNVGSNKEKILSFHQEGKSNMAIAKSLGLGIGEVKLIIDLFENGE